MLENDVNDGYKTRFNREGEEKPEYAERGKTVIERGGRREVRTSGAGCLALRPSQEINAEPRKQRQENEGEKDSGIKKRVIHGIIVI